MIIQFELIYYSNEGNKRGGLLIEGGGNQEKFFDENPKMQGNPIISM